MNKDRSFEISSITPLGDPDRGETYNVELSHVCPKQESPTPKTIKTSFGRFGIETQPISCTDCGNTVIVHKNLNHPNIIYLSEVQQ